MEVLIAICAIFIGSFVQTAAGFGLAVVAAPILFFLNPAYVPAPITISAMTLALVNAVAFRQSISFRGLQSALIGRVPGSIAGALLLYWIDQQLLGLWLGIAVLGAVAISLTPLRLAPTPGRMMSAGFLSGFMGTSTSIGGPPMALLLQHENAIIIRANLAAFFTVSCLLSIIVLIPVGYMTWDHVVLSAPLLPAVLAGFWLARRTDHLIPERYVRAFLLLLCTLSGLVAVLSYRAPTGAIL